VISLAPVRTIEILAVGAHLGGGAGLAAEPFDKGRVLHIGRAEHLDRHLPLEHPIGAKYTLAIPNTPSSEPSW
jgi:hypothetical protein